MIRYPGSWAETHGVRKGGRVEVERAAQFVRSVQSAEFGTLIESHNMHVEEGSDPDSDPAMRTERRLQEDLNRVIGWLEGLRADGQETISVNKVLSRMESETGYEVVLT